MKKHLIFATALLLFGVMFSPAEMEKSKAIPTWISDKAFSDRLAPDMVLEGFRIQPPLGYSLIRQTGPQGEKAYGWKGAERDGVSPSLTAVFMTAPSQETNMPPLQAVLSSFVRGIQRRRTDWKQSDPELGSINGLAFMRARWDAKEPTIGSRMHGFVYVALSGRQVIEITSQDVEPYYESSLKLAEASVFTFKKQ